MLTPSKGKVIIEQDAAEQMTPGGIAIPLTSQTNPPTSGRIVAVHPRDQLEYNNGDPMQLHNSNLREGVRVLFATYAGHEIENDGRKLKIINVDDILAFDNCKACEETPACKQETVTCG